MRYYKKIKATIFGIINELLWLRQSNSLSKSFSGYCKHIPSALDYKRILIIVPHADDELVGCFNLIKQNKESVNLFYLGLTGANCEQKNKTIRQGEFESLCKNINVKCVISEGEIIFELTEFISVYSPDLILLPSYIDWHKEHRDAHYYVERAMENMSQTPQIGLYKISMPLVNNQIDYIIKMNKFDQYEKWETFEKYYKSQSNIPQARFRYEERLYGLLVDGYAAEIFSILNYNDWKRNINKIREPLLEERIKKLKQFINNIELKYKKVGEIVESLENRSE